MTDSFRSVYSINAHIPRGAAVAVGRYPEDVYFEGNPWYLTTLAAAEQLFDSLYVWEQQGLLVVTATSLSFFRDFEHSVNPGEYNAGSPTYEALVQAIRDYADGYVAIVQTYAQNNGSLSEQFSKTDGEPLSAYDLTWSYASFLTAAARRAGIVPRPWIPRPVASATATCSAISVVGSYSSVTEVKFPPSLTPTATSATRTVPTTTPPAATTCITAITVIVTFAALAKTEWGQTIKIVGDVESLGSWDPSRGLALDPSQYTADRPLWSIAIELPAGESIQYKYVNIGSDGSVVWEGDPNRAYAVPLSCETAITRHDIWQG